VSYGVAAYVIHAVVAIGTLFVNVQSGRDFLDAKQLREILD
jgi:hypothetical protein